MHELSIASAVVDSVLEYLDAHEVKKVMMVRLAVGELSHVEAEQLRFCYMAITQETAMENSTLEIESVPAIVECPHCSYHGTPQILGRRHLCRADSDSGVPHLWRCRRTGRRK